MSEPDIFRYLAFGLHWQSDRALDQFPLDPTDCVNPDIIVSAPPHGAPFRLEVTYWHNSRIYADGFRFQAEGSARFDYFDPNRLHICQDAVSDDVVSPYFYGTVAAGIAAYHGGLPLHGTAMESDGAGVLLCGPGGVGKSSTAAALAAKGFRLISDDLSVLRRNAQDLPVVSAGRTDIRLVAPAAKLLRDALPLVTTEAQSYSGKVLVRPQGVAPTEQIPLRTVISFQSGPSGQMQQADVGEKIRLLSGCVFRPRLMQRLPGETTRAALLLNIVASAQMLKMMTPGIFDDSTASALAEKIEEFHYL